jgi:hypothetical protein
MSISQVVNKWPLFSAQTPLCELAELSFSLSLITAAPSLWSSGQSSWLQIQRSGLDSRRYQIFWEAVGLARGTLSLVSTIEELLERKSSGSGLENRDYCVGDSSR